MIGSDLKKNRIQKRSGRKLGSGYDAQEKIGPGSDPQEKFNLDSNYFKPKNVIFRFLKLTNLSY